MSRRDLLVDDEDDINGPETTRSPRPAAKAAEAAAAIQVIWARARAVTLERVEVVEEAVLACLEGRLHEDLRAHAEREAHKVAGSVGSFGFARASALARELELFLGQEPSPSAEQIHRAVECVADLQEHLPEPAVRHAPHAGSADPTTPRRVTVAHPAQVIALVTSDEALAERLTPAAAVHGFHIQATADVALANRVEGSGQPAVALLDVTHPGADPDALLQAVRSGALRGIPSIILTGREELIDRVAALRAGARVMIRRTDEPGDVIAAAVEVLHSRTPPGETVVVLDDDATIHSAVREALQPAGVRVVGVEEPTGFWRTLEETPPDLVVLDLDLPEVGGLELCRAMRADPRYATLPVLVLTRYGDPETIQEVFSVGADDFVTKPIAGPELLTRVSNRLERSRLHRRLADTDPLTGLANRRSFETALRRLLSMSTRHRQPLAVALLDLDQFNHVNDTYGHAAGDEVLRTLAGLLVERFRDEDVVGRSGGEELAIAMYGMRRADAVQRLAEVLDDFGQLSFTVPAGTFSVTFSGGVSQYPDDAGDLQTLVLQADQALLQAKRHGGRRVLPVGWQPPLESGRVDVAVVEDDQALAPLLQHALAARGLHSTWLRDGVEAASKLIGDEPSLRPHVLLLDVDLPGLNGLDLLRALVRDGRLEDTRVIMLTAHADESEVLEALRLGAVDHVAKPFSVPVLLERIRRALPRDL